jgi:hypothetical protein
MCPDFVVRNLDLLHSAETTGSESVDEQRGPKGGVTVRDRNSPSFLCSSPWRVRRECELVLTSLRSQSLGLEPDYVLLALGPHFAHL